ncbi:MAG: hypothetical protein IKB73_02120, partial [Ruminococcus sp.]|nr:hypothetical protein [Ruminococcus sp.]
MLLACEKEKKDYTLKFITTPVNAKDTTAQFPYQISLSNTTFTTTPQKFSQELARTCIVLSSSAYEHDKALDNLNSMGFEHNAKFNYSDDYDQDGVGLLISSQKIGKYTLVAVALRGTFQKEWYSNFDIGHDVSTTKVHSGFNKACEFSLNNLERYFHNYGIDRDHCKFLITGHSRGAAVANLLAKSLIDIHGSDNVYAYTFATPNTTTNEDYSSSRYKGIFNFVNPED